ncbi:MAG TPA: DUF1499 domain-containing protein [Longimicrobiales bacterium]|nr:DUF1499 domain-containing protein [Longimicrobiales bacterium]
MSGAGGAVWRGLTQNAAATSQDHDDPRLRGRTYAIPYERVWQAAVHLAGGGLRGWRVLESDDQRGTLRAEARARLTGAVDDVYVRVYLDRDAQTRVDARAAARDAKRDYGRNARRLRRFFEALDQGLGR